MACNNNDNVENEKSSSLLKSTEEKTPFTKIENLEWAKPKGFPLTMDIYTPNRNKESYPVIVMFHGGGWLINNETIMDQSCAYLTTHSDYVVCNVNYRLLVDLENTTTLDEIVEDVFGAVLWIKQHIKKYKGDPSRVIVTGDSAGGHLAMMVAAQGHQLSSTGFDESPLAFTPTWLPEGKMAEQVAQENGLEVQAAILSYGAFNIYKSCLGGFEKEENIFWGMGEAKARGIFGNEFNAQDNPEPYKKVSPIFNIPLASERTLPPLFFTVGEKDNVTTPESIQAYMEKLREAGHSNMEYWVHEGRPHAFLDSGSNEFLGIKFEDDAPPALDKMIAFMNNIFYPN